MRAAAAVVAVIANLVTAPTGIAQDSYLCAADAAAGFAWQQANKNWQAGSLSTSSKYVIKKGGDPMRAAHARWTVTIVGEAEVSYWCFYDFKEDNLLACESTGGAFKMNRATLRYQAVLWGRYLKAEDVPGPTPAIEIGKCSPL